jgi:hypothetical protein
MPLVLKRVEPARGATWLRDAFRLFVRRPLPFTMLFSVFLFAALVISLLPLVGGLLQMMMPPLLSLGFMIASQSALLGGRIHPAQFIEPLRGDPARRRSLLLLCLIYGLSAVGILLLCQIIAGPAGEQFQDLMVRGQASQTEVVTLLSDTGLQTALLVGFTLGALLTVPFWHAPALVHWGAQGVGQALFSSTLAVWRSKGAFLVYAMTWVGLCLGFAIVVELLFGLLGTGELGSLLVLPLGLMLSTVFYVSLLFTFNDSFGSADAGAGSATEARS